MDSFKDNLGHNLKYPVITVAGGSCSGKTTFAEGFRNATKLSIDNFYKDIADLIPDVNGNYDFDTPDAIDLATCRHAVEELAQGRDIVIPSYDYVSARRVGQITIDAPSKKGSIIVLEGIFALYPPLHDLGILRIYIEAPPEIRIARRITVICPKDEVPPIHLNGLLR